MHPYESFVHNVAKPARYMGGEYNSVQKPWDSVRSRFVLAFPDIYDIGMSHLGTKILYSIVNAEADLLMERCFCPWIDMEAELRSRELPLVSLESHRPLRDFDVVGFSLQYEMTFTNVLTILDLGGIPIRNRDRAEGDAIVIAGGPTVTHPEAISAFVDAFVVGDAEEKLPQLLRRVADLRQHGATRREILVSLAELGGVYCPDLYARVEEPLTGMLVVGAPLDPRVPAVVERAFVPDISRYRFPDDSPVPVAEAIFDRMSVEIARGCTEGCRFCQAGMIYRPVRERDPDQVIETVLSALDKGGYDEAAITSLSTADYSCIAPLIKTLMEKLRDRRISLGISSLRAYGLAEETLDEIATVKATGLTFAPEAGTQRMRDVINKNVSEEELMETCNRVFSRGWNKMKLYFILGLPTETEEDVYGIADVGRNARQIGLKFHRDVNVTISVSSHVPKPHTPFQWAAMDPPERLAQKQRALQDQCNRYKLKFKKHEIRVSFLEGIIARGDARACDLVERAWRNGARFDGWDDQLKWDAWQEALNEFEAVHGLDRTAILDTIPVDARLPWDHIDVGLEDGFLLKEYRKSLVNRLSPPCGKPFRAKVHHTNIADAVSDDRKLVCYDCGIACDMSAMRTQRLDFLEQLGATEAEATTAGAPTRTHTAQERHRKGLSPHQFEQGTATNYRLRFTKLGSVSLEGHLDLVRTIPRLFARAGYSLVLSKGFSPKPHMSFGPALGLGARAIAELVDVSVAGASPEPAELLRQLNAVSSQGLQVTGVRRLEQGAPGLSRLVTQLDFLVSIPDEELDAAGISVEPVQAAAELSTRLGLALQQSELWVPVTRKDVAKTVELWSLISSPQVVFTANEIADADRPLGAVGLRFHLRHTQGLALKPTEVVKALLGVSVSTRAVVRMACLADDGAALVDAIAVGDDAQLAVGSARPLTVASDVALMLAQI